MNEQEYEKTYPARKIEQKPEYSRYSSSEYWDAHQVKDKIEIYDEVSCEVVEHDHIFYVIYRD